MIQSSLGREIDCALATCRAGARYFATFALFRHVANREQKRRIAARKNLLFFFE